MLPRSDGSDWLPHTSIERQWRLKHSYSSCYYFDSVTSEHISVSRLIQNAPRIFSEHHDHQRVARLYSPWLMEVYAITMPACSTVVKVLGCSREGHSGDEGVLAR